MIRRLRQEEGGWALLTAVLVLSLMLSFGLAAYATVGTQTSLSKVERNSEASFTLSEGALTQQGYVLGFNWPANTPGFQDCSYGAGTNNTPAGQCPQPANLTGGNFTQVDYNAGASWKTVVRDNRRGTANSDFYGPDVNTTPCMAATTVPCTYDANKDGKLWVRASATVRGRTRTIVALLKREKLTESLPRATLRADHFATTNNGNKVIIDSNGSQIVTRCVAVTGPSCNDYEANKGQVTPNGSIVQDPPQPAPTMDDAQLERFKAVAMSSSPVTYYTSCPSSLTGAVVYIDLPTATQCSFNGNGIFNSATSPGLVIMPRGSVALGGGVSYHGVLYLGNKQNTSGAVLSVGGNANVLGGVIVDGPGGIDVGSSGSGGQNQANLQFSANAFNSLSTFGTAGLAQNTWRELPAGTE